MVALSSNNGLVREVEAAWKTGLSTRVPTPKSPVSAAISPLALFPRSTTAMRAAMIKAAAKTPAPTTLGRM